MLTLATPVLRTSPVHLFPDQSDRFASRPLISGRQSDVRCGWGPYRRTHAFDSRRAGAGSCADCSRSVASSGFSLSSST
jgi:hypothetical protein